MQADFDWSDVGSWQAMSDLLPADGDGNRGQGEHVSIATRGTYVHAESRVVATVGVDDLVIVDTEDAVLVAHRGHLQRVKEVVGELKARGHEAYRTHKTVARPWGTYTVLQEGPGFKIKRIEVKPGAMLSLQLHHHRSEHWVVVAGIANVTRGADTFTLRDNESTYIPPETQHRLENPGTVPLQIIEVQCGEYVGEDDIVRFDDRYGRIPASALAATAPRLVSRRHATSARRRVSPGERAASHRRPRFARTSRGDQSSTPAGAASDARGGW